MKHHAFESCPWYLFNTFSFFQYSIKIITMVLGQKKIVPNIRSIYFLYSKASFKLYDLNQLYPRADSLTSLEIILRDIYQPNVFIHIFH